VRADCKKCRGCGQVADTADEEPWIDWTSLPLHSAVAVVAGIVRPKQCPACSQRHASNSRPPIVCLCGSTRFMDAFFDAGWAETLAGKIVLSVGVWREGPTDHAGEWIGEDVKRRLDELHLRKIDLADEVLILNVGGYIGESTRREIEHAERTGKSVRYLEAP